MAKDLSSGSQDCGWSCARWTGAGALKLWILFVGVLILLPFADAQTGFTSIDCGSPRNYTDERGIDWTTDDGYIATGSNLNVTVPSSQVDNVRQLITARSFPSDRQKSCYIIPDLVTNASYLVRLSFLYGDLTSSLPSGNTFRISIDSSIVAQVDITSSNANTLVSHELFVATTSEELAVCLLPVVGVPFISSLELRRLDSSMYRGYMFSNQYGKLTQRLDAGARLTTPTIRYPDDDYDRVWKPPGPTYRITTISTSVALDLGAGNWDETPLAVMQTGWAATGRSLEGFWFNLNFPPDQEYYAGFYFAEILQTRTVTDRRVLDMYLNGEPYFSNYNVSADGSGHLIYQNGGHTGISTYTLNFSFEANRRSTLSPLLNAFEIHELFAVNTSTTASADRQIVDDIRESLNLMDWTGDPCFPVPYDWITCSDHDPAMITQIKLSNYNLPGTIPPSIARLASLKDLWLDGNVITGSIPDLSRFINLRTLHLQNNSLTGPIPESLAAIPTLTELYLQDNHFNGTVPAALLNKNGVDLQVDSSNRASNSPGGSPLPSPPTGPSRAPGPEAPIRPSKKSSIGIVIGGIAAGVVAIIVGLVITWLCIRRRRKLSKSPDDQQKPSDPPPEPAAPSAAPQAVHPVDNENVPRNVRSARAFSMAELNKFTNNWQEKIGEGGYGPVYYGKIDDGKEVAAKQRSDSSHQGGKEFATEVSILSRIHHRNLVHLVGFCNEGNRNILVYEYMKGGTLQGHLYGKGPALKPPLEWPTRLEIAIEAARGLEYLHNDCDPRIVHRDVKSTNILLDRHLHAKVADFGTSKVDEENKVQESRSRAQPFPHTSVKGTHGYIDPEYLRTLKLTYKIDVYAFGVVLLELISGRPPLSVDRSGGQLVPWTLVDYTRQMMSENRLEEVADRSLREYHKEAMWKVAELAMRCVEDESVNRPDMREVVKELGEAAGYIEGMELPRSPEFEREDSSSPFTGSSYSGDVDSSNSFSVNSSTGDSAQLHPQNSHSRFSPGGPPRYAVPSRPSYQNPRTPSAPPYNSPRVQRSTPAEPWGPPTPK